MPDRREIEFFFDVGSPYSYLASTQIDALGDRVGRPVRWRPFLLGGVFKATGNDMPARGAAKAQWMLSDLALWAEHYGVPFRMSSRFPLNTLRTQRALAAAGREDDARVAPLARAFFHAMWAEDRDVSSDEEIARIASECGLDGEAVVAACAEQEVKDVLRGWTEEAVSRGAFGAPTMFVDDTMYWGNDRLSLMQDRIGTGD